MKLIGKLLLPDKEQYTAKELIAALQERNADSAVMLMVYDNMKCYECRLIQVGDDHAGIVCLGANA